MQMRIERRSESPKSDLFVFDAMFAVARLSGTTLESAYDLWGELKAWLSQAVSIEEWLIFYFSCHRNEGSIQELPR